MLDPRTARFFTGTIQQFQRDIHREWHGDTYDCWTVNRGIGWADNTAVEAVELVESGTCRLYPNGAGGPQSGEMVIHVESPYRVRTLATSSIDAGHLLVINGARLFRVDVAKRGKTEDVLVDVYLTELFATPMPGEVV